MTGNGRRQFLRGAVGGVASGVAGGILISADPVLGAPAPPGAGRDPRTEAGPMTGRGSLVEALATPGPGEECVFVPGSTMVGNGFSTTSALLVGNGARPSVPDAFISAALTPPVGATLTAVDVVVTGSPLSGAVGVVEYVPELGSIDVIGLQSLSGTGIKTIHFSLNSVFDGTNAFEAYFTTGATTACNGVRYTYRKPSAELVAMTPTRVYDSRFSMSPDASGAVAGDVRTISVANARNLSTGAVTGPALPASERATAIAYTLTITNTVGAGFIAVNPGGQSTVSASAINWSAAGQSFANTGVVKLGGDRQITIIGSGGGGRADVIVDLVGFYR